MDERIYTIKDLNLLFKACSEFFQGAGREITVAYLYGSMVKEGTGHDLDVAVFGDEKLDELRMGSRLERWLFSRGLKVPVDLKNMSQAPIWAQFQVIKEGKRVFQKSREEAIELEFWIITRYLDFKPTLDAYNREARKRILRALNTQIS